MDKVVDSFLADRKLSRCESCNSSFVVYKGLGEYKCDSCGIVFLDDYGKIRNYIEKYGPNSVQNISEATGVSRKKVNMLLHEGKVALSNTNNRSSLTASLPIMRGKMRYVREKS
jgi:predicted RNA-binding Zn-ribbon protein involved in translation (DUF1610 family)